MAKKRVVTTTINGETHEFLCKPQQTLLEVLRDTLDLTGQGDVSVIYTSQDKEDGYVFLNEFGEYVEFTEIENILIDGSPSPDGIVEGTFDGDIIDDLYLTHVAQ